MNEQREGFYDLAIFGMRYGKTRSAEHHTAGDKHPDTLLSSIPSCWVGAAAVRPITLR